MPSRERGHLLLWVIPRASGSQSTARSSVRSPVPTACESARRWKSIWIAWAKMLRRIQLSHKDFTIYYQAQAAECGGNTASSAILAAARSQRRPHRNRPRGHGLQHRPRGHGLQPQAHAQPARSFAAHPKALQQDESSQHQYKNKEGAPNGAPSLFMRPLSFVTASAGEAFHSCDALTTRAPNASS